MVVPRDGSILISNHEKTAFGQQRSVNLRRRQLWKVEEMAVASLNMMMLGAKGARKRQRMEAGGRIGDRVCMSKG